MSIQPYPIQAYRDGKWQEIQTDALVPGDLVSISTSVGGMLCARMGYAHNCLTARTKPDSGIPCDLLLLRGTCIVNEAMLSGESTPLLKESVELRDGSDRLDMNGSDRNNVIFSGTKALQVTQGEGGNIRSKLFSLFSLSNHLRLPFLLSPGPRLSCRGFANWFRHNSGPTRSNHDLLDGAH
jgi:cation-transporting ATPase 13A1